MNTTEESEEQEHDKDFKLNSCSFHLEKFNQILFNNFILVLQNLSQTFKQC